MLFRRERLRRAREVAGLSQSELARKVGVTPRAVSYWEHGEREPRTAQLQELARILDVPPSFFYGEGK